MLNKQSILEASTDVYQQSLRRISRFATRRQLMLT